MRLDNGSITASALTQSLLENSTRTQADLNAYITLLEDEALRAAAKSDERSRTNRRLSPLDGIGVAIKDLFDVEGVVTAGGCEAYRGRIAEKDAGAVAELRKAGAVLLGKTNTDELGLGARTDSSYAGPVRNPWDLAHVPGGSSGGSAAAVAAGLAYGAIGSDTGGSVRDPASMCGITGMKPTFGRVSRSGMLPFSLSLDHTGVLAHTAEGCALLLDALVAFDPRDPDSLDYARGSFGEPIPTDLQGLRIAVIPSFVEGSDPAVEANFQESVRVLSDLGVKIGEAEIFEGLKLSAPLVDPEFTHAHRSAFERSPDRFGERVRTHLEKGSRVAPERYREAVTMRQAIEDEVAKRMRPWDAVICPTSPVVAERIDEEGNVNLRTRNTVWFNISRQPAVAVPNGLTGHPLPTSLMIAGRKLEDAVVLRIARAYQSVTGHHTRRPPYSA